jgi:hypothetical protein
MARWLEFREQSIEASLSTLLRFEETFQPWNKPLRCAVKDNSMLMFFPDRRVFQCSMFLGLPDGNMFHWNGKELIANRGFMRRYGSLMAEDSHCPAMRELNQELCKQAERQSRRVGCIFDKEEIQGDRGASARALFRRE